MTSHQVYVEIRTTKGTRLGLATRDDDGKLYARVNGRWWMLSRASVDGWRSVNAAPNDPELDERLDRRSGEILPFVGHAYVG